MPPTNKETRLFIRITDKDRATLQSAADREGLSLSAYVRRAALLAAKKEAKR